MTDLKPCPFCGSSDIRQEYNGPHGYEPYVVCVDCGCCVDGKFGAWNTRAALATPAPDAVQEAARVPEIAALIEAAKALHRDMLERAECKMDTISGEQYRIVNSGRTAWADFDAALRAIAGGQP